jgi:hypothetical protein
MASSCPPFVSSPTLDETRSNSHPVKLFHPPMTAKEFSGWYEVIFAT